MSNTQKQIYVDHSATTPVDPDVLAAMLPYFTEVFGNANSLHTHGRAAAKAVDDARARVAAAIGAKPKEIYFTAGGTEGDNWALRGTAWGYRGRGDHIIISAVEHPAVMTTAKELKKQGFSVSVAPVKPSGIVDLAALEALITDKTILISVMLANNEVGTVQPVRTIADLAHARGILMHTDAVQAVGSIPVNVDDLGADMLTLSAHKFYGPKGIGALYIRNGIRPDRILSGGHQERTRRGGTTNVPGAVGLGEAITRATQNLAENAAYIARLRDRFVKRVKAEIPYVRYNGDPQARLPQNANFSFELVEGESILFSLDLAGISASSGSACSSGSLEPSHVLLAIGVPIEVAHGSIRFSFGKGNTEADVDYIVDKLKEIITRLRVMSPLVIVQKGETKNV
ncbi:MAG: cysteine desulfurase NifS [Clostridiales bacterium]|jgi:cysteine desulfurase|nr:cysteine desulfurase NifS [Clostridiales bacterium]